VNEVPTKMQDAPKFEIRVPGFHGSVDEARQARGIPASELPPISEEEHEVASKLDISDESYRRGKLAGIFGQQRIESRAADLGRQVEELLAGVEKGYGLSSVTWNGSTHSWTLEIATPQGQHNVALSGDLVNDVLDSKTRTQVQRLRNMVLFGLGRRDLIFEKHQ
jgi:hypothetical protein